MYILLKMCVLAVEQIHITAHRSEWRNMLCLSNFDKVCVNTEIELFDKDNNCLICDWFANLF